MKTYKTLTALAKAPSSAGSFDGLIDYNPPEGDHDNERIANFANVPGQFPLGYTHAVEDPGAQIGRAQVRSQPNGRYLMVSGRLDLKSAMARAVHERMLLPSDDPMVLKELSVGFEFDPAKVVEDPSGVKVIRNATLREISIVYRGAQTTQVTNVKSTEPWRDPELARLNMQLDSLVEENSTIAEVYATLMYGVGAGENARRSAKQSLIPDSKKDRELTLLGKDPDLERYNEVLDVLESDLRTDTEFKMQRAIEVTRARKAAAAEEAELIKAAEQYVVLMPNQTLPSEADRTAAVREQFDREAALIAKRDAERKREDETARRVDEQRRSLHR